MTGDIRDRDLVQDQRFQSLRADLHIADDHDLAHGVHRHARDLDAVLLHHQASRRAEIVDPREELPGPPAVVAAVDFGPHVAARIALRAHHAQHAPVGQHVAARVEPAVAAEAEGGGIVPVRLAERIVLLGDERQEMEVSAVGRQREHARVAIPAVLVDFHQPDQRGAVGPHQDRVHSRGRIEPVVRHRDRRTPAVSAILRHAHQGASGGRAEARARIRDQYVPVEEVDRLQVAHRLGLGELGIGVRHHVEHRLFPGAAVIARAQRDRFAAQLLAAEIVVADRGGAGIRRVDRGHLLEQLALADVPVTHRVRPADELVLAAIDHQMIDIRDLARLGENPDRRRRAQRGRAQREAGDRSGRERAAPRDPSADDTGLLIHFRCTPLCRPSAPGAWPYPGYRNRLRAGQTNLPGDPGE